MELSFVPGFTLKINGIVVTFEHKKFHKNGNMSVVCGPVAKALHPLDNISDLWKENYCYKVKQVNGELFVDSNTDETFKVDGFIDLAH